MSLEALTHGAPILDGRARLLFRGRAFGSASLRDPDAAPRIADGARRLLADPQRRRVVAPWLDFVHAITDERDLTAPPRAGVHFASRVGDGFLLRAPATAVYLANGDCAIGVLACDSGALVVLHLGLACLDRDDDGPTLLEQAVRALSGPPRSLAFWVGCGIGSCCLAYDHGRAEHQARASRVRHRFGADVLPGPATRGPRAGQQGYDTTLMALREAERLGVGHLEAERQCTSCAGVPPEADPAMGTYFSNVRDVDRRRERNLVLVAR